MSIPSAIGRLTDTLRLFLRVCETVGFAHAHGVVHRDLKPSNIMVGPFGEVLVLDWGIARLVQPESHPPLTLAGEPAVSVRRTPSAPPPAEDAEPDTSPGTVLGTPGLHGPRAGPGLDAAASSPRSDVTPSGAILRFLVERVPRRAGPRRPLVSIWTRAMRAEPDGRYAAAAELGADVTRFLDGAPVAAHRESLAERAGRSSGDTRRPSSWC